MKNRILGCYDCVLDSKYFILSRKKESYHHSFEEDNYFYNIVEDYLIKKLNDNKNLLIKDVNLGIYLNEDNFNLFKIIYYEDMINLITNINKLFSNELIIKIKEVYIDYNYLGFEYTLEDLYIVLEYIQKRSIYLNLKI